MSKPPTLATLMLDGREPFQYPPSLATCVRKVLALGEYNWPALPDEPPVRRFLDIGSNVGAFACWIFAKRGPVYVDCYEPHPEAAKLCAANGPPGCTVHNVAVSVEPGPYKLHVGSDWGFSSGDPTLNPRSGEIIECPTLHPKDLPPADGIKVDGEGIEVEVLSNYPHLSKVGFVMFEWHREADRPVLEKLMMDAGLRLFKSVHDCVSLGLQVWIRSKAVNGPGHYVMPLP